jgi:hypothetical protein
MLEELTAGTEGDRPALGEVDLNAGRDDTHSGAYDFCLELGGLNDGALVFESGLARMFGKHPVSIKRAIERGELPPPTRLMGKPVWTVGAIRRHIEERLETEARYRRQMEERMTRIST